MAAKAKAYMLLSVPGYDQRFRLVTVDLASGACKIPSGYYDCAYTPFWLADTVLPDGRIFLTGGESSSWQILNQTLFATFEAPGPKSVPGTVVPLLLSN